MVDTRSAPSDSALVTIDSFTHTLQRCLVELVEAEQIEAVHRALSNAIAAIQATPRSTLTQTREWDSAVQDLLVVLVRVTAASWLSASLLDDTTTTSQTRLAFDRLFTDATLVPASTRLGAILSCLAHCDGSARASNKSLFDAGTNSDSMVRIVHTPSVAARISAAFASRALRSYAARETVRLVELVLEPSRRTLQLLAIELSNGTSDGERAANWEQWVALLCSLPDRASNAAALGDAALGDITGMLADGAMLLVSLHPKCQQSNTSEVLEESERGAAQQCAMMLARLCLRHSPDVASRAILHALNAIIERRCCEAASRDAINRVAVIVSLLHTSCIEPVIAVLLADAIGGRSGTSRLLASNHTNDDRALFVRSIALQDHREATDAIRSVAEFIVCDRLLLGHSADAPAIGLLATPAIEALVDACAATARQRLLRAFQSIVQLWSDASFIRRATLARHGCTPGLRVRCARCIFSYNACLIGRCQQVPRVGVAALCW